MKEQDLLKAIHNLPDQTVEHYALPKSGKSDALPDETAAGKEHIMTTNADTANKKPIRIHRTGIAAAILICLGLNAGLFFGINKLRTDNSIIPGHAPVESVSVDSDYKMPSLIGMDFDDALVMYGDIIQIVCDSEEYSDYEDGIIFDQDIPANEPLKKGDTVHVKVSIGAKKVQLPDVAGWDFETAKTQILALKLYVYKRCAYDNEVPEGKVISTDPVGPAELEPGTYVRVTVSLGPNNANVLVPNFVGMRYEEAKEVLESMGLVAAKREVSGTELAGKVLAQDINPGEEVAGGTTVTLDVVTGESNTEIETTTAPNEADSEANAEENTVVISFRIPEDAVGTYHIALYENGIAKAVGGSFDPQFASGVAALTVEGSQEEDLTAVLVNDTTGAEATLGIVHVNFDTKSTELINDNINAAFAELQNNE